MGINKTHLLVYGVDLKELGIGLEEIYENERVDSKYYNGNFKVKEEYQIINDGSAGEYTIFGYILAKGDEFDGIDLTEINTETLYRENSPITESMINLFSYEELEPEKIKLFCFTHFS